jgi:hypothetical protein
MGGRIGFGRRVHRLVFKLKHNSGGVADLLCDISHVTK